MKMIHCFLVSLIVGIVSQSVTADTGNNTKNDLDVMRLQQDNTFNENRIKSFVYYVFSLYDTHAEADQILSCLAEEGIEIHVPDAIIRTHEDFKRWYTRLGEHFHSSTHTIEHLTVTVGDSGQYEVDVVVHWHAVNIHNNPVTLRTHQRWQLVDGDGEIWPRIHRISFLENDWYFTLPAIPTIEEFVYNSLALSFVLRIQEQFDVQQNWTPQDVGKIMAYFGKLFDEMSQFGSPLGVREILIYDKHQQLLTLYQSHETSEVRGVYLPSISTDAFIPLQEKDMWFITATSLEEIPRQQIPTGIATTYQAEFPEATMMQFTTFGEQIMIEFITPIKKEGEIEGICIIHIAPQNVMTR